MSTVGDFKVHGFDVSSYQPPAPDFRTGGREFGIFKATEGIGYFDRNFAANRTKAHAQNLAAIGMYHFARPAKNRSGDEAEWFLSHVTPRQPGEFAVLDYEVTPWNEAWAVDWITRVKSAGWKVLFYTYLGMWVPSSHTRIAQAMDGLWIAAYGAKAPSIGWMFWQHTDGQSYVGGNDGRWDCSVYRGSVDDLRQWVGSPPQQEEDVASESKFVTPYPPRQDHIFLVTDEGTKTWVKTVAERDALLNIGVVKDKQTYDFPPAVLRSMDDTAGTTPSPPFQG